MYIPDLVNGKLIIDWSVINHKNFRKMSAAGYEAETGNEHSEYAINMYLYILYLVTLLKPEEIVFALDGKPYWRNKVYKDWYIKNSKIFQRTRELSTDDADNPVVIETDPNYFLIQYDQKTLMYTYSEDKQGWFQKKLTKADVNKINWDEMVEVGEPTREEINTEMARLNTESDGAERTKEEFDEAVIQLGLSIKENILYTILKEWSPVYKGGRSSTWDFDTPKQGYTDDTGKYIKGFFDLSEEIAYSLAGTFNAIVIKVDGAEADDVIAHYVKTGAGDGRTTVVVSIDSDLHQLKADNMFMEYFNPNMLQPTKEHPEVRYTQWGEFWNLTAKKAKYDLRLKILSGDKGDNITPCQQLDPKTGAVKTTCIGKVTAEKWLSSMKLSEIAELTESTSFERNRILVHLDNIPKWVRNNIALALKQAKVPSFVPPEEYNVPPRKRLMAEQAALSDSGRIQEADAMDKQIEEAGPYKPKPGEPTGEGLSSKQQSDNQYARDNLAQAEREYRATVHCQ